MVSSFYETGLIQLWDFNNRDYGIQQGKHNVEKYGDPVKAKADDKSYLAGFFMAVLILGLGLSAVAFVAETTAAYASTFRDRVTPLSSEDVSFQFLK